MCEEAEKANDEKGFLVKVRVDLPLNGGGRTSVIRLAEEPAEKERECAFSEDGFHALEVWDARPGEVLSVEAPSGRIFRARIAGEGKNLYKAVCFEDLGFPVPMPRLHLFQALPEKERFELILEKAAELGADAIHPFVCRRSASLEERDSGQKKSHRWPHLLQRASRQCRRLEIPELYPVKNLAFLLEELCFSGLFLVLDEKEKKTGFARGVRSYESGDIALIVGPEGGFDRDEIALLCEKGAKPVTLGSRILRTETAAILAIGLVRYADFLNFQDVSRV